MAGCICPWQESQHSGDWAVAGSSTCSSGVWPLHSPAPHGFPQGLWLRPCPWGFLLGWLGETRDRNKEVRVFWMLTDMESSSLLGILLLLMCYFHSSCSFSYSVFMRKDKAHEVLQVHKYANHFLEVICPGNLERECNEEKCSFEEAKEIFQSQEKMVGLQPAVCPRAWSRPVAGFCPSRRCCFGPAWTWTGRSGGLSGRRWVLTAPRPRQSQRVTLGDIGAPLTVLCVTQQGRAETSPASLGFREHVMALAPCGGAEGL